MATLKQSIIVEQRKNPAKLDWEISYHVQQTINITTPKINDVLNEAEINQLINSDVKVTIKQIS